jgi:hypothetical protein
MMTKLRSVPDLRADTSISDNEVGSDKGFFETVDIRRDYTTPLRKGSEKKTKVLVYNESDKLI